jgi:hypothetical protein
MRVSTQQDLYLSIIYLDHKLTNMKEQTLEFYWLKYEAGAIRELIQNSDGIDSFVFSYYFPESYAESRPLQLVAYAHMVNQTYPEGVYSTYYDVLSVYHSNPEEISGPAILSNNMLSLEQMETLINSPEKPDYLVFTPHINQCKHIYYTIKGYKDSEDGDSFEHHKASHDDPPPVQTNPSPPAT